MFIMFIIFKVFLLGFQLERIWFLTIVTLNYKRICGMEYLKYNIKVPKENEETILRLTFYFLAKFNFFQFQDFIESDQKSSEY